MNYKFLFLVGSSINHFQQENFSAYAQEQRFNQTLQTIKCIRKKVPNSYILLFECSQHPINEEYKKILIERCDLFLDLYDDVILQQIYQNIEKRPDLITYGKSLLETRGLLNALYTIKQHNLFNDSQRIFKMTGRYLLNDDFNIQDYESKFLENKYVIKRYHYLPQEYENYDEEELGNIYAYLYGAKGSMMTGLWSFDRNLFTEILISLEKSFAYMERMIQYTVGTDIEHSLYRFINKENVVNISNLGLTVIKGMRGENGGIYNT
jgi:hypothetical protein